MEGEWRIYERGRDEELVYRSIKITILSILVRTIAQTLQQVSKCLQSSSVSAAEGQKVEDMMTITTLQSSFRCEFWKRTIDMADDLDNMKEQMWITFMRQLKIITDVYITNS